MPEPLKHFFSPALIQRLGEDLARAYPEFPQKKFVQISRTGLEEKELLDRGRHLAESLGACLPPAYPQALQILLGSLGPEHPTEELKGVGLAPFYYLPHVIFVAERGLDHFDLSMKAQYELTKRFTAEFSVRGYIERDPERAFGYFRTWLQDPNPHVRRLVSEGTRWRLPWARRVPWLDAHPERVLELLEVLKDDSAPLVRRSVANSLNDLGKLRPDLLLSTGKAWLKDASVERRALVEHAFRSAVKRGDAGVLSLLGYGGRADIKIENVRFHPRRVPLGGRVEVSFDLRNRGNRTATLLVDLVVGFQKAKGRLARKVFKLKRLQLPPKGQASVGTRVSLGYHTTRTPRVGRHPVSAFINGRSHPLGAFWVVEKTN